MKKLIITLLIAGINISSISASDFEKGMLKGIEMLTASSNAEASTEVTNFFARLSEVNKGEWLPLYFAAYSSLKSGFQQTESSKKDEFYKQGLEYVRRANAIKPDNSEILTMEGYLKLMYISNSAMTRAPSQTGEAIELLEKAKALDPSNPRPWLVHGQNTLFTPAFFGGGEKNAKPLLEKAMSLYKSYKPASAIMPDWGKERCEKLLEQSQ
jgi:tetratricopeptide (TPR) repeat protein